MKLEVYFIRHGESWANKIQQTYGSIQWCIADPSLTPKGMDDSKGAKCPQVDIVCCSELLRAKQTAIYMYPDKHIYVVPGTKELGLGLDNIPLRSTKYYSQLIYMEKDNHCVEFIDYLKKFIHGNKIVLKIALITHHRFIAKHTNEANCKNNQVVKTSYEIKC
tara:strand:+ start:1148 stop:1636 length:489 start_codon:yes stop_codon:yes gene_type:complete